MGTLDESTSEERSSKPLGIRLIEYINNSHISYRTYQRIVLVLTFLAYASYHATRKTTSIVKSALDPASSQLGLGFGLFQWKGGYFLNSPEERYEAAHLSNGWAPFNEADGSKMLGELDVAFLVCYSFWMYFAGHLGDRLDLQIFLTVGMVGSGMFTSMFGFGN